MRFVEIATFLLIFNVSISIVMALAIFPDINYMSVTEKYAEKLNASVTDANYTAPSVAQTTGGGVLQVMGDFLWGTFTFIEIVAYSTVWPAGMLQNFMSCGTDVDCNNIALYIGLPLTFIFGLAIVQIVTGRAFRSMQ